MMLTYDSLIYLDIQWKFVDSQRSKEMITLYYHEAIMFNQDESNNIIQNNGWT